MMNDDPNSLVLRRAAVLLQALAVEDREQLLRRIPQPTRAHLESALDALSQVPVDEAEQVRRDFVCDLRRLAQHRGIPSAAAASTQSSTDQPLVGLKQTLERAPLELLQRIFMAENRQFLAIIVTCLPPGIAADLLAGLDENRRTDVLQRILDLEDLDEEALWQVQQYLTDVIQRHRQQAEQTTIRLSRVKAIFGAADSRLKAEIRRMLEGQQELDANLSSTSTSGCCAPAPCDGPQHLETSIEFDRIVDVPFETLSEVLARVPPDITAVAIMGASQAARKIILGGVAETTRTRIQQHIAALGPLRVTDIQLAQRMIMRLLESKLSAATHLPTATMTLSA